MRMDDNDNCDGGEWHDDAADTDAPDIADTVSTG
jgi:hypothetical protein